MSSSHQFAIVTRDEVVSLDRQTVLESRLIHGIADDDGHSIVARDDCDRELRVVCDREAERMRSALEALREGVARSVVSAERDRVSAVVSVTLRGLSIVTSLPHLNDDYALLQRLAQRTGEGACPPHVPLLWRNGSGAVLLHEAIGHADEHPRSDVTWPVRVEIDRAMRRESFSDVPLDRMTRVFVHPSGGEAPPPVRAEILLVAGGRYEPLTETVTISISAANLVDRDRVVALKPFVFEATRADIARSLRSAGSEVVRYPGVICSREGQELFVESFAPDLLLER